MPLTTNIIRLKETTSTNDFLRHYEQQGEDITVVTADYQTAGRGQRFNTWESEPGRNLLFSILVRPTLLPVRRQFLLSEASALTFRDALTEMLHDDVCLKWPNDLYWHERKIGGTLIETSVNAHGMSRAIIGTGIDVNQTEFSPGIPNPVSMRQILGHDTDCNMLLDKVINKFEHYYGLLLEGRHSDIASRYRQAMYRSQGLHAYRDREGAFDAEVADVEEDGHLILRDREGRLRRYAFKEVRFVI